MTTTDYPMPATNCPTWCERDHSTEWAQQVAVGLDDSPIPKADGTLRHSKTPLTEWLADFEPLHVRTLSRRQLDGETFQVELQRSGDGPASLWVDARGSVNAEEVRAYAVALIEAAARLDEVTGR